MDLITLAGFVLLAAAPTAVDIQDDANVSGLAEVEYRPDARNAEPPVVRLAMLEPEPTPSPQAVKDVSFGAKGSMRWSIQGAFAAEFDDSDNRFFLGGLGFSYFLHDDVSIDVELNGLSFTQEGNDPAGVNLNCMFRWHFLQNEAKTWSIYADGGVGILWTSDDVPDDAASFNFTPQLGAGATYAISTDVRLFGGVRWHHISNGNTYHSNPGRNSYELYMGLSFPF